MPNGVINGGVTSLSLILSTVTGADIAWFSNGITSALMLLGLLAIGRAFFLKSLLSSLLYMGLFTAFRLTGFHIPMLLCFAKWRYQS